MEIKAAMKSHRIAILLALLVGLVSVAPQLSVVRDAHYKGIQMFGTDAENQYIGRVNQALYEDYSQGSFPVDPGKNYYLAPKLGERLMALFAKIFNTRVIEINVALKFVGPVLLFFILYAWLLEMFSLRAIALIAPLFVILGINLLSPTELLRLGALKASVDSFLPYTRPISPLISSLFLFLGLWGTYRLAHEKSTPKTASVLGILVGLSLYSYIFTYSFLVVVLGLSLLYFLIQRDWRKVKNSFIALAVSGIVVVPYLVNLLRARTDPDYLYMAARQGLVHTHAPILGGWVVVGFLALIFIWPRAYSNTKHYFLILFSALVVVLNQQLITGVRMQPGHYHWFTTKPLVAIIISVCMLYWLERVVSDNRWKTATVAVIGSVFFLNAIAIQAHSYSVNYPMYEKNQRYASLFTFLDTTYTTKMNIWANPDREVSYPELSFLISAYTHHNAAMVSDNYSDSQNHVRDMLFLNYRLHGIDDKNILKTMQRDRDNVTTSLFGVYYRDMPGGRQLSDSELQKLALVYNQFYAVPLGQVLRGLRINLIVEDTTANNFRLDVFSFLSRVYDNDGLYVYELKNK